MCQTLGIDWGSKQAWPFGGTLGEGVIGLLKKFDHILINYGECSKEQE